MTTSLHKKGMVLGIICLFIGAGVVPSIGGQEIIETKEDEVNIDSDIRLTKAQLPLLIMSYFKIKNEKINEILGDIINRILQKSVIYSTDIEEIIQDLNISTIGIHFNKEVFGSTCWNVPFLEFYCFPGKLAAYSNGYYGDGYEGFSFYLFLPYGCGYVKNQNGQWTGSDSATVLIIGYNGRVNWEKLPWWNIISFDGVGSLIFLIPYGPY